MEGSIKAGGSAPPLNNRFVGDAVVVEVMVKTLWWLWKEREIITPTHVFSMENPRTRAPDTPGARVDEHVTRMGTEGVTLTGGTLEGPEGATHAPFVQVPSHKNRR